MAVPLAEPSAHGTGHMHNPAAGARMKGHEQLHKWSTTFGCGDLNQSGFYVQYVTFTAPMSSYAC